MRIKSLMGYFSIYSLIAFVITGILLSWVISNHIKNDRLNSFKGIANIIVNSTIKDTLNESDYKDAIKGANKIHILNDLEYVIDYYKLKSVSIINRENITILSSDNLLIEKEITDTDIIKQVIKGQIVSTKPYKFETLSADTDVSEVFDIYAPIKYKGKNVGVFRMIVPYKEISMHTDMLISIISKTQFFGLFILFFLLLRIIHSASKTLVNQNKELNEKKIKLEESYKRLNKSYLNTVISLSNAVDARDPYTAGHSTRVAKISLEIGGVLGFSEDRLKALEYSALFHDIGKIGIPDYILNKKDKLTDKEYEIIKKHPDIGVNILQTIDFMAGNLSIIRHHHERYSGGGYPMGLSGKEIPLEARIIAIADTYDAMTSDRPYRKGLPEEAALNEIIKNKEIQFDGKLVDAFIVAKSKLSLHKD
ncbi:HD-GYP domain-containing protein [Cellulosilyticum sp. I15G10I2]|uniref:HD-GYP domain-containing protein n=1 Tax=Cellulosilyticum sp. I15G10I2 TaxID=1892843 RepID=UPI00085C7A0B|nr:HD-GYP domain-containing protein [Cellulosilyticum sp. I15G10I2]